MTKSAVAHNVFGFKTIRAFVNVRDYTAVRGCSDANHNVLFAFGAVARQVFALFESCRVFRFFSAFLFRSGKFFLLNFFEFLSDFPGIRKSIMSDEPDNQYPKGVLHNVFLPQKVKNIINHVLCLSFIVSQKQYKRNLRGCKQFVPLAPACKNTGCCK